MLAILLAIIFLSVNGCERQISQPTKSAVKTQASKASKENPPASIPIPAESAVEEKDLIYSYRAEGRRDPFKSLLLGLREKKSAGLTPLQQRSLGELRVIGIVWGVQDYMAMIEAPDGKGFLIREGTLIGPNGGIVKKITEDSIIIEEIYTDFYGKKKYKKAVLGLHAKEEGGG